MTTPQGRTAALSGAAESGRQKPGALRTFRIVKREFAKSPLSGEGARLFGGRWNSPGVPAVYLAASVAQAMLEMLVHLDSEDCLTDYVVFAVLIPATLVKNPPRAPIPPSWLRSVQTRASQRFGDEFLTKRTHLAMAVPCVVVPGEHNYVLNPLHPAINRVKLAPATPLRFDPRLM